MTKSLKLVSVLVSSFLLFNILFNSVTKTLPVSAGNNSCQHNEVRLCHHNEGNGYVEQTVDDDAVFQQGHTTHQEGRDIIPPFSYYTYDEEICVSHNYAGQNWPSGQATWDNDCVVPQSTPTPTTCPPTSTPTNTPINTPTSTPTPTPTQEITGTPVPTPTSAPNVGGGDNGGGNPGAPACNDADPGAPSNLRATALGGGKVRLDWDNAPGPHTSYAVAYGPSIGNYIYGDPNVGNVTTYTVKALNPGGKYCFYVQAQNGCRGGSPSNVVCSNQGAGSLQILGVSDNFNPLVHGIRESYGGEILGATTELASTAEVTYSDDKLPSGNTLDEAHSISISKIGVDQAVYLPQKIGDELVVGQHEVLYTTLNHAQFYYGHNATDVFGGLYKLNTGDKLSVTKNGKVQNYVITKTDFVKKDNVDAVKADSDQVILMTCSYTQPDYRILVTASLIK